MPSGITAVRFTLGLTWTVHTLHKSEQVLTLFNLVGDDSGTNELSFWCPQTLYTVVKLNLEFQTLERSIP